MHATHKFQFATFNAPLQTLLTFFNVVLSQHPWPTTRHHPENGVQALQITRINTQRRETNKKTFNMCDHTLRILLNHHRSTARCNTRHNLPVVVRLQLLLDSLNVVGKLVVATHELGISVKE